MIPTVSSYAADGSGAMLPAVPTTEGVLLGQRLLTDGRIYPEGLPSVYLPPNYVIFQFLFVIMPGQWCFWSRVGHQNCFSGEMQSPLCE